MSYEVTIRLVRQKLEEVAVEVEAWFDKPNELRQFKPPTGGWSINEVLEHITLTNTYLRLTCRKHCAIAIHRARRGDTIPEGESDLSRLHRIGQRGIFPWVRPQHMEPKSEHTSEAVRATLHDQWTECHESLNLLEGGKGALCNVTMTVDALGKIDLYQWIYFLALHARRHVGQMSANEAEYLAS